MTTALRGPRLRSQVGALASGRLVAAGVSALWFVVMARYLPIAEVGDVALLLAIGAVLGVAADFGLSVLLADAIGSGQSGPGAMNAVIRRRVPLAACAAIATAVLYAVMASHRDAVLPLLFGVSLLATAVHSSAAVVLRANGRSHVDAVNEMASRLLVLGVGWLLLTRGGGARTAVAVYAAADALSAGALYWRARAGVEPIATDARTYAFEFRRAAPIALGAIVATLYFRVDVWVVSLFRPASDVATYAAAYRIFDGLLLPAGAMAALIVARTARDKPTARIESARWMALGMGLFMLPAALLVVVAAPWIVETLFGPEYSGSVTVLRILAVAAVPSAAAAVCQPAIAVVAPRRLLSLLAVLLVVNVVGNLVVVPAAGVVGAAWMTLVCQTAFAAVCLGGRDPIGVARAYWRRLTGPEPRDFTRLYDTVLARIDGWRYREDLLLLYLLAARPASHGVVLEIGSFKGLATTTMAYASGCPVVTVDPHTGDRQDLEARGLPALSSYDDFRRNLNVAGVSDRVVAHVMTSDDLAGQWGGRPIRLLFVDGWHSYDAVRNDLCNFVPHLTSNGVVVIDDYGNYEDVRRAVDDHRWLLPPVVEPAGRMVIAHHGDLPDDVRRLLRAGWAYR